MPQLVQPVQVRRNWSLNLSIKRVTKRFAWRHIPYLAATLGISIIGRIYFSGHPLGHPEVVQTFQEAAVYALLAGALLILILSGPLDHQFILSIVRSLFFLAIFYVMCALMRVLVGSARLQSTCTFLTFGLCFPRPVLPLRSLSMGPRLMVHTSVWRPAALP